MPVEAKTINYLRASNHEVQADLVQAYTQANGLYCTGNETPEYTDVLELDLGT
jgi:aconitate hydratase